MIDVKRIEEMKRLSAEATEGVNGKWDTDELFVIEGDGMILGECVAKCETEADAQFIAESRQFVPDIIAAYEFQLERLSAHDTVIKGLSEMVERRDAEIAELRKALEFYADEKTYDHVIEYDEKEEPYAGDLVIEIDAGKTAKEALK